MIGTGGALRILVQDIVQFTVQCNTMFPLLGQRSQPHGVQQSRSFAKSCYYPLVSRGGHAPRVQLHRRMVCLDGDTHESVLTEPDSPALHMTAGPSSNSQISSFAVSGVLPFVQMRLSGSERESVDHQTAITARVNRVAFPDLWLAQSHEVARAKVSHAMQCAHRRG